MQTAIEVMRKIEADAKMKAKPDAVKYGTTAPGDYHRQGDVYIRRLKALPKGLKTTQAQSQLAPGETQGSRHCLESIDGVKFYAPADKTPLDGPILQCDGPVTVTHPEHGHVTLPAGVYSIHYQRQYAEELRRVQD